MTIRLIYRGLHGMDEVYLEDPEPVDSAIFGPSFVAGRHLYPLSKAYLIEPCDQMELAA